MGFRRALLDAALQVRNDGTITRGEFRRLWVASWLPGKLSEIEDYCWSAACAAGHAQGDSPVGFDWTALLDFLKELMPFILQIIALF